MPTLLELPNEILDQIIDDTIPESVEAFSESCMQIRSLAKSRRDQHLHNLRSYCTVELSNCKHPRLGEPTVCSPLELLKDILQKPYLSRYPQKLTLGVWLEDVSYELTHSEEFKTQIVKALIECWCVPSEEVEEWAKEICRGEYDAGTALLLALLPNVQYLHIHLCSFGQRVKHMVFSIAEASLDPQFTGRCLALSRVVKVHLASFHYDLRKNELEILAQLSALPSVNILRCIGAQGLRTGRTDWNHHGHSGGVTKIEISEGMVHPDAVSQMIRGVRALKFFTYEFRRALKTEWYPSRICQVLRQHAKDTLEDLRLTWTSNERAFAQASIDSLRDFQMLRRLRVRYTFIVSVGGDGTLAPAPLVSMLPPSLKELRLIGGNNPMARRYGEITLEERHHLAKLFDGLPESKEELLPNLIKIDCEDAYHEGYEESGLYQQIRAACMSAGVTVNGLDRGQCCEPWGSFPPRQGPPSRDPQQQAGWSGSLYQKYSPDLS